MSDIRLKIDELLKIWQAKWNLAVDVVSEVQHYRLAYNTDPRTYDKQVAQQVKPVLLAAAGPLDGLLDSQLINDVLYFYHVDHLSTPIMMTDKDQNVVWEGEFLPFGEMISFSGSVTNNLRFPGQYYDEETGLHYNWHRDYMPEVGRYIEFDPLLKGMSKTNGTSCKETIAAFPLNSPQELNPYAYVGNNPVNFSDPEGLTRPAIPGYWSYLRKIAPRVFCGMLQQRCKYAEEQNKVCRALDGEDCWYIDPDAYKWLEWCKKRGYIK